MSVAESVVLVVGGGSGVGAACALAFAAAGARVVIAGRRASALAEVAAQGQGPHPITTSVGDAADRAQAARLVADAVQRHGRIDVLLYCAGVNTPRRRLADLSPDDWDRLLQVNATGAWHVVHAALPVMRHQHGGLVIAISSTSGLRPGPLGGAAYSAGKAALSALCRVLNAEEGAAGIRASVISPGEIDTPLLAQRPTPVSAEQRARMLQPADIAAAALFIATLPPRATVAELVITPATQPFA